MSEVITDSTDAMLDLESLGTTPFSPLLSIGACGFGFGADFGEIVDTFYQAIKLESCLTAGLRINADTLHWWMKQSEPARAVFTDPEAVDLPLALDAFTDWFNSRPMRIWGNSARFDCGLLEAAYKACGKEIPWRWSKERCYRTVCNMQGARDVEFSRIGTYHNALDDAVSQAYHLRKVFGVLKITPQ